MLFLDGAYTVRGRCAALHRARGPSDAELTQLLETLSRRIVRLLERRGLLIADPECPALDLEAGSCLDQLQAASVNYRIAIGPHAGRKALTLYSVPPTEEAPNTPLLARLAGFSLHAASVCEAYQRSRLERLYRFWPNGLASVKWTVELSPYCPFLELDWTDVTNVTMSALAIVKTFNVVEHIGTCLVSRTILASLHAFPF